MPAAVSISASTPTNDSGSGWQSGISSDVRLAAWIAGDPGDADDVALGRVAGRHARRRLRRHADDRLGERAPVGARLGADVDHPGAALGSRGG